LSRIPVREDAAKMVMRQDDLSLKDMANDRKALTKAQLDDPNIGPILPLIMRSSEAQDISQLVPE